MSSYNPNPWLFVSVPLILLVFATSSYHAFMLVPPTGLAPAAATNPRRKQYPTSSRLFVPPFTQCTSRFNYNHHYSSSQLFSSTLPDISNLTVAEMRKELESYGISTKSFLEKKEFVQALTKARAEGKTPTQEANTAGSDTTKKSDSDEKALSREERIAAEMEKCQKMKVTELKKELESLGISTKSFFEKSEFVKTLATARVDGTKSGSSRQRQEANYDPAYKDVKVEKFKGDPRLLSGTVIDVKYTVA